MLSKAESFKVGSWNGGESEWPGGREGGGAANHRLRKARYREKTLYLRIKNGFRVVTKVITSVLRRTWKSAEDCAKPKSVSEHDIAEMPSTWPFDEYC